MKEKIISNFQKRLVSSNFSDEVKDEILNELKTFTEQQLEDLRTYYIKHSIPQPLFIMQFLNAVANKNKTKFYAIENGNHFHFYSDNLEQAKIDVQIWGGELTG